MKRHGEFEKTKRSERMAIFEMIDAACELAARKGAHPLQNDCNCIACVNKRKRLLEKPKNWKFRI
jgi:hypothetical protein